MCLCGCGQPVKGSSAVAYGHGMRQTRCEGCGGPYRSRLVPGRGWTRRHATCATGEPRRREAGTKGGISRAQQKDVPAARVQKILYAWLWKEAAKRSVFPRGGAALLAGRLGVSECVAHKFLTRPKISKEVAARLLALVADIPRTPSLPERRRTDRDLAAARQRVYRKKAG